MVMVAPLKLSQEVGNGYEIRNSLARHIYLRQNLFLFSQS